MKRPKGKLGIPPSVRLKTPAAIDAQPGGAKREYGDKMACKFDVTIADEVVATYYTFGWGPWDHQGPGPASLPDVATAASVAEDLVQHYGKPFPPNHAEPEERQSFGDGEDLAVWFNTQLVAIVMADHENEGKAVATVLNDVSLHDVEFVWGD